MISRRCSCSILQGHKQYRVRNGNAGVSVRAETVVRAELRGFMPEMLVLPLMGPDIDGVLAAPNCVPRVD